jgi:hypothetical protein
MPSESTASGKGSAAPDAVSGVAWAAAAGAPGSVLSDLGAPLEDASQAPTDRTSASEPAMDDTKRDMEPPEW